MLIVLNQEWHSRKYMEKRDSWGSSYSVSLHVWSKGRPLVWSRLITAHQARRLMLAGEAEPEMNFETLRSTTRLGQHLLKPRAGSVDKDILNAIKRFEHL